MSENRRIISLKYQIPVPKEGGGDVMVSEITLERMKVKHLHLLPKTILKGTGDMTPLEAIPVIAGLSNLPEKSIEEIDMEDLIPLMEELGAFLSGSPSQETGTN